MPAKFYTETVYWKYHYFATWEPNQIIRLGDIGTLKGYEFEYLDNLANLGIPFTVRESGEDGQLDFISDKQAQVSIKLAGEAPRQGMNLSQADAGFQVSFKAEKALLIKVDKVRTLVIDNQIALGQEIARRYNQQVEGVQWQKEWVVVTEIVKGDTGTIIVAKDKAAHISVRATATINAGTVNLADASLDFELLSARSIGAQTIAKKGITPLFKLKGIKKAFPWQSGRFKARSAALPEALVFDEMAPDFEEENIQEIASAAHSTSKSTHREKPRIWLFSVGINNYQSDNITDLDGCVKDVENLSRFLRRRLGIPGTQCKIIINEEATRAGIIRNFRTHFEQLEDGDIALFHYSGHGSWEYTHQAFAAAGLESKVGHNEVIVCHDSKMPGIYNLADKELRQLVSELQYPKGENPKDIHFVSLFDCCHSGSMLRQEFERVKVRHIPGDEYGRPLGSYLDGVYATQYDTHGKIALPPVNYISLSACSPNQSAVELPNGGLFTQALIETLHTYGAGPSFPSYAELYTVLHEMVKHQAYNDQTPYLEYAGRVNPITPFLQQGEDTGAAYSQITKKGADWQLAAGGIHGLPYDGWSTVTLPVFDRRMTESIGYSQIKKVGLESSMVKVNFMTGEEPQESEVLFMPLLGRKLPITIRATATAQALKEALLDELQKQKHQTRFDLLPAAAYSIRISPEGYHIYHGDRLIFGISEISEVALQFILERLHRIAKWEQINALQAPSLSMINPQQVSLELNYWNNNKEIVEHLIAPDKDPTIQNYEVIVDYDPLQKGRPYYIEVTNHTTSELYFYLVHLDRKFGIAQKHENYPKPVASGEKKMLFNSIASHTGFGISDADTEEVTDVFLLITSLQQLTHPFVFAQDSFEKEYGKIVDLASLRGPKKLRDDIPIDFSLASWTIKRMEVKVRRC